ncbi:coiled-coil domain-containing protein 42-like isoform X2 [Kryptolebias marmoratus]|uniref:Coiled-coil domain-containing protein 42-like n=1 Tax=Kryptolebias marmoratus TaxID=37003 RepID=A0A3Q3EID1_KRYMA|nr:coiled-coil domain-containing protein 42-like isoform X2 [Kryptolebias marmoratus]
MFSKLSSERPVCQRTTSCSRSSKAKEDEFPDLERLEMEKELADLMKTYKEYKEKLVNLRQQKKELQKDIENSREQRCNLERITESKELEELVEKAEKEMTVVREQEETIKRIKQEHNEMFQSKKEMEAKIQKYKTYYDFMDQVCKLTKFKNMDELADHFENQLQIRDQLIQKEKQKKEHMEQQKKKLRELEDQHDQMCLEKTNELAQLQTELEEARAEALIWEKQWNHIQETASKKTLELGQIKMATLNLYERTSSTLGAEGVAIDDTDKQLEHIQTFIMDSTDIVKQYRQLQKKENTKTGKTQTEK